MSSRVIYQKLIEVGFPIPKVVKFKEFHDKNPDVWREFEAETLRVIDLSPDFYSADDVAHAIRLKLKKEINNNWISFYARVFAFKYPQHANFFRYRKIKQAA